jgi:hypothetical protein
VSDSFAGAAHEVKAGQGLLDQGGARSAEVEFCMNVEVESGKLAALLVGGSAAASQ